MSARPGASNQSQRYGSSHVHRRISRPGHRSREARWAATRVPQRSRLPARTCLADPARRPIAAGSAGDPPRCRRPPRPWSQRHRDRTSPAIELKYLTRRWSGTVNDERFDLAEHSARDICGYDVIQDIVRMEKFIAGRPRSDGAVVVVTNDAGYWKKPHHARETNADAFRLSEGTEIGGRHHWRKPDERRPRSVPTRSTCPGGTRCAGRTTRRSTPARPGHSDSSSSRCPARASAPGKPVRSATNPTPPAPEQPRPMT